MPRTTVSSTRKAVAERDIEPEPEDETSARVPVATTNDAVVEASQRLVSAWASGTEAILRGVFNVQNALLDADLSLIESIASDSRAAGQQWGESLRLGQEATLDMLRAASRAVRTAEDSGIASTASG
jgi:hypothetical protein